MSRPLRVTRAPTAPTKARDGIRGLGIGPVERDKVVERGRSPTMALVEALWDGLAVAPALGMRQVF